MRTPRQGQTAVASVAACLRRGGHSGGQIGPSAPRISMKQQTDVLTVKALGQLF